MLSVSRRSVSYSPLAAAFIAATITIANTAAAQSPRLGPDDARFKTTMSNQSTSSVMGMTMDIAMEVMMIARVTTTAAGRDTLRVRTVVDSVSFSLKSPMLEASGMSTADMAPFKKGDTSIVLMSTSGALLSHVAGSSVLGLRIEGGSSIPAGATPGQSWAVDPPKSVAASGMDISSTMVASVMEELKGMSRMTYEGIVDREGARAWKLVTSTNAVNKTFAIPQTPMTMTIKEMTGTGATFIDLSGRMLHHEYSQKSTNEMSVEGTAVQATTSTMIRTERIR